VSELTKTHAFQIKDVIRTDWMFSDDPTFTVVGHREKERMHLDAERFALFKPEPGHYCIVWSNGLKTFRPEESFLRDFKHLGGTVYETRYVALFQGVPRPNRLPGETA